MRPILVIDSPGYTSICEDNIPGWCLCRIWGMIWKWQDVQVTTLSPSILAADLAIIRLQADHHRSDGMSPKTGWGWVDSPTVHGQSWACSWQCFNSQRWAKSKPKQHTATDNCILWPLWIFGSSLLFGPQLAVAPGPPVRNPNRSKAAPGWHVCFKATKSACCFSAPAGSILCPFFSFGLRSTKNRLQMHLFDQQKICTRKGEKLRYLGKFHWRPV